MFKVSAWLSIRVSMMLLVLWIVIFVIGHFLRLIEGQISPYIIQLIFFILSLLPTLLNQPIKSHLSIIILAYKITFDLFLCLYVKLAQLFIIKIWYLGYVLGLSLGVDYDASQSCIFLKHGQMVHPALIFISIFYEDVHLLVYLP